MGAELLAPVNGESTSVEDQGIVLGGRMGLFFLLSDKSRDFSMLRSELCETLDSDSRVQKLIPPDLEPATDRWESFYPPDSGHPHGHVNSEFLGALDTKAVPWFSDPFAFWVHVPIKNQKAVFSEDTPPAEDYWAFWDGRVLLVCWEQPKDVRVSLSGGYIVADVLDDAAHAVGATIYNQRCSRDCSDSFAHAFMKIEGDPALTSPAFEPGARKMQIEVRTPLGSMPEMGFRVFMGLRLAASAFGQMKNTGRRLLQVDHYARYDLAELLHIHRARADITEKGLVRSVGDRWRMKGWRRHFQTLLANLWLAMSSMERLTGEWTSERRRYLSYANEDGVIAVFDHDDADEAHAVQFLDVSRVQAAAEHLAGRLDMRALILATVSGAVIGAIAGVVVGRAF